MREMVERAEGPRRRARRRREDPAPRRLGARAARPRGADRRTCGPRPAATTRRASSPPSTPAASPDRLTLTRLATSLRADEVPRGAAVHEASTSGCAVDGDRARSSGSPTSRRTRSATSSTCSSPTSGSQVIANASIAEIESTKSVSEIYAPVTGTVVEVNEALDDAPEQLNTDPYGAGLDLRGRAGRARRRSTRCWTRPRTSAFLEE